MKFAILASTSVFALMNLQTAALAQQQPVAVTPSSQAGEVTGLEDIIVTAQRQAQNVQSTPLAISVVTAEDLVTQNVTRAEDLSRVAPALVAANSGGPNTVFFLRGVGNFTVNAYSDAAIAFNYDGVYIGRPTSTSGYFYDLERVEVLKGPQGTLYGRNATGGAINVIPRAPILGVTNGNVQASYGNYDAYQGQAAVNVALGENAALRLSGTLNKHDGYLSDGTGDQDDYSLRAQLLVQVAPEMKLRLAADYGQQGGVGAGTSYQGAIAYNGTNYVISPIAGLDPSIGVLDPRSEAFLQTRFISAVGRNAEALGTKPYQDNDFRGVSAEINWRTPMGEVTIQPAYREANLDNLYSSSGFRGVWNDQHDEQVSLEMRLAGSAGPLDYLVGGFVYSEDSDAQISLNQLSVASYQAFSTGTDSQAIFGKLTFNVTDTFALTAAGRYTEDDKVFNGRSNIFIPFCGSPAPPQDFCPTLPLTPLVRTAAELRTFYSSRGIPIVPGAIPTRNTPSVVNVVLPITDDQSVEKFTYRLAADWQVRPRSLLYASYETGFRGGGFSFARGLSSFEPETITAFTVGSKNRFFDNMLQINAEVFHWKYEDQQLSVFGSDLGTPPAQVFYTTNVGSSTIKGVDLDVIFAPTSDIRLSASVQYLDATYDDFTLLSPVGQTNPSTTCPFTREVRNGVNTFVVDCAGQPLLSSPEWSFNLNAEKIFTMDNGYEVVAQAGTRYRGDYFLAPDYQPWVLSEAEFQSNASLTLASPADWSLTAYVNNIEDHRRSVQVGTNTVIGHSTAITTAPRTYGVRVSKSF